MYVNQGDASAALARTAPDFALPRPSDAGAPREVSRHSILSAMLRTSQC
jgi:hypothetical protein